MCLGSTTVRTVRVQVVRIIIVSASISRLRAQATGDSGWEREASELQAGREIVEWPNSQVYTRFPTQAFVIIGIRE